MARRLPHEGEAQDGVLLAWPHEGTDWRDDLAAAEAEFRALAAALAAHGRVVILSRDEHHAAHIRACLDGWVEDRGRLCLLPCPFDDTWPRDFGPLTVIDEDGPRLVDFRFDGWGGKYPAGRDDAVTRRLHAAGLFRAPLERHEWVLEGGAVDSDGAGTLLLNAPCVLDPRRNPGLTREAAEARLRQTLGARRILWLEVPPLSGDDTDGHIDTLARFADPGTLLHSACDDPAHPDHAALAELEAQLRRLRRADGDPYRLVPLPLPRPLTHQGRLLPANYANFLVLPEAVLVPQYGDRERDDLALERVALAFPGRTVAGVPSTALIRQNGSLHCLTMQLPRGTLAPCPASST